MFLADGCVAGELPEPTAEGVLEAMKHLERPARAGRAGVCAVLEATLKGLLARRARLAMTASRC